MRLILIIVLIAVAMWILIAGIRNQKRISFLGIFLMLLPAGALGYFEYQWQTVQDEISVIVQDVTGKNDTKFECERLSFAFFDAEANKKVIDDNPKVVKLKYAACAELLTWYSQEDKSQVTEEQIKALHLFSRETMRVAGNTDDKIMECLALKNESSIIQNLGGSKATGDYVMLYYVQQIQDIKYRDAVYC